MRDDSKGTILEDGSIHYLNYDDLVLINRMLIERQTPQEPNAMSKQMICLSLQQS